MMTRAPSSKTRHSPHLSLRPFRRRDGDALLEAVLPSLDELNKWLPWAHGRYSRADAAAFIRESMSAWSEGRAFDFAVRSRAEPERHLGNVSVWFTSRAALVGEMGYWVRTDETGRGICTEATARALEIAFQELNMHRVTLRIAEGNVSSERVADKLGFTREGMLREEVRVNGVWLDHSVWGLLEHEYRETRTRYSAGGWA